MFLFYIPTPTLVAAMGSPVLMSPPPCLSTFLSISPGADPIKNILSVILHYAVHPTVLRKEIVASHRQRKTMLLGLDWQSNFCRFAKLSHFAK